MKILVKLLNFEVFSTFNGIIDVIIVELSLAGLRSRPNSDNTGKCQDGDELGL